MNSISVGVDIIEISRIRSAIDRWKERFLGRIFTESEIQLYRNKTESLAVRFAAKEAVIKALAPPVMDIKWRDIEVLSDTAGKPYLRLYGKALEHANNMHIKQFEVSLSHSRENAIALVIGLRER